MKSWNEEVNELSSVTRSKQPRYTINAFLFAATVYHNWMERNSRRFIQVQKPLIEILKDIALQLHIVGQRHPNWPNELDRLIGYPS